MRNLNKYLILFVLAILVSSSYGQSKKVWLFNANTFYAESDYASALKYYHLVLDDTVWRETKVLPYETTLSNQKLKTDSNQVDSTLTVELKDYINHQIAMCYRKTFDYKMAANHFKETAGVGAYPNDEYYYANALMNIDDYEGAIEAYDGYIKSEGKSDILLKKSQFDISGCHFALNPRSLNKEVTVRLSDTGVFNKGTSSFAAMFWGSEDKMLFTSAREKGVVIDASKQDSKYLLDLYWTERIEGDSWGQAHNFGRPLNSSKHEASASFNNGNSIFFTKWSNSNREAKHIYVARMFNLKFFESMKLDSAVNIEGYKSINPYVTIDGKWLYFSSNRPGGIGGMDIWKIRVNEYGATIGKPKNLGTPINSEYNEVTPFFHETTSTLFFSSNGHKSMGGLDVFKSSFDRDAQFYGNPQNMGQPINSSKDDSYMIWDKFLKYGWLSSDREPCEGGHCFDIYNITNSPIKISIEGFVFDDESQDPIPNASIEIRDVEYSFDPFTVTTDETGFYESELTQDVEIFMKATKKGYFADAASQTTKNITQTTVLTQDFFLRKIPEGEIAIDGIEYDFDSDKLRPKSKQILDTLYEFLVLNNNLVVQINSHTDNRGNDAYNLDLSKRRAKSCVDYLLSKGLPIKTLTSKGFGETTPTHLVDESKDPVLDKEGNRILLTEAYINSMPNKKKKKLLHQKNRRTAFKVLGEGFNLDSGNM